MEAGKTFKPDKEVISQIESGDESKNLAVIEKLRSSGKAGYIPYLIDLAGTTPHPAVSLAVFSLLNDLKDKSAAPFVIESISDGKHKPILKKLVESCWQNRLDYSRFLPVFIDLLLAESEEISFEAFTVIENMAFSPDEDTLKKEVGKIENLMETASENRRYFLSETIKILTQTTE
jgi:hypothetical protein